MVRLSFEHLVEIVHAVFQRRQRRRRGRSNGAAPDSTPYASERSMSASGHDEMLGLMADETARQYLMRLREHLTQVLAR